MGKNFANEWTDHAFTPWTGCTEVPPGVFPCPGGDEIQSGTEQNGPARRRNSRAAWNQPPKWNLEAAQEGRRHCVECAVEVFDPEADPEWRADLWDLIRLTPYLDWVFVTDHPDLIAEMLPPDWNEGWANVCLMVRIGAQEQTARIPLLLEIPARHRGLVLEPLLSPVKLPAKSLKALDWVTAGGESGADARPTHPDWVRSVQKQCEKAGVRFYFKQWGNWSPDECFAKGNGSNVAFFNAGSTIPVILKDLEPAQRQALMADDRKKTMMYRTTSELAGAKLDGRIHRDHPFGRAIPGREIALPLTSEERHRLRICERTIREGLGTFVAVGSALMEIRNARLYRQTHRNFEAYVESVLALTRPRAYQLMDSAQVMHDLSTIGDIGLLPQNEAQTRELCRWKSPEERAEKWKSVLSAAGRQPVTARFIRQTLCPASEAAAAPDPNRRISASLTRLRHLLEGSPAEARALKLIARLEEIVAELKNAPEAAAVPQADLWLPGFE